MHRFLVVGVAALAALALSAPAAAWTWPADGSVLRPYGIGADPYAAGQHRGIDVAGPDGMPIRAPAAGTVTFAGALPTHGRGVTIQTADGYAVTLVHLGTIGVEKGASVTEGAPIGTMGSSGTPEHAVPSVHLGIRRGDDTYVDPLGLLPPRAMPDPSPDPVPTPAPGPTPVAGPAPAVPPASPAHAPPSATAPDASPGTAGSTTPSADSARPASGTPAAGSAPEPTAATGASPGPVRGTPTSGTSRSGEPGLTIAAPPPRAVVGRVGVESAPGNAVALASAPRDGVAPKRSAGLPLEAASTASRADAGGRQPERGEVSPVAPAAAAPTAAADARRGSHAGTSPAPGDGDARAETVGRGSRGSSIAAVRVGHPLRDGGVPFGPLVAAFLLGCVVAAAGIRRSARRIGGNGAVLPDNADLLRQLDAAHRARVYDGGRGRLHPPPAAARS